MGNYVSDRVGNYVSETSSDLGNFMIGDIQAVHAAAAGDALIAPNITRRLLSTLAAREPSRRRTQPIEPLTEREEEVLALVARGRTNAEIAADLFIGLTTAKTHVASLLAKIGARNRVEIAMWAYDTGRVGD